MHAFVRHLVITTDIMHVISLAYLSLHQWPTVPSVALKANSAFNQHQCSPWTSASWRKSADQLHEYERWADLDGTTHAAQQ